MARLLKMIAIIAILFVVLYFGGYTFKSLSKSIEIRNPEKVMSPLTKKLPEIKEDIKFTEGTLPEETIESSTWDTNDNPAETDENGETIQTSTFETDENGETIATSTLENTKEQGISFEYTRILKINIGDKTLDLSNTTSAEFIKWLTLNYNSNITYIDENGNKVTPIVKSTIEAKIGKTEKTEATTATSSKTTVNPALAAAKKTTKSTKKTAKATTTKTDKNTKITYTDTLKNEEQLNKLINSIEVVKSIPEIKGYKRDDYEKPIKKLKLNGKTIDRNNYAWMTSPWYNKKDKTYLCPYTGTIIKATVNKKNNTIDFQVDYDHIVPLKSTYIRGGNKWTNEQKNKYAYDQWVAVDVLPSANRSKSDKGLEKYMTDINKEDYCFTWLQICSKYNLKMSEKEIEICKKHIKQALKSGEPVTHMGGKNP